MRHEAQGVMPWIRTSAILIADEENPTCRGSQSKNLCEAWVERRIRDTSQSPGWFAYLWLGKATSAKESMFDVSIATIISKRRYGMKAEGNPVFHLDRMKSILFSCESLWLIGYKPCSSAEGATCGKITGQIHKACYPELECSGNLNPSGTVHLVNVGISCFGQIYFDWTGCG